MTTTATHADPFALLDGFADESDELAASFAAVVASGTLEAAAPTVETPAEVEPEVRCLGCRRPLRSAASRAAQMGRTCLRNARRRAETLTGSFSDDQVEKAVEAVEDGAVIPAADTHVWLVVGSKGDEVYRVQNGAVCDCPAGEAGRVCWHLGAVALVAA